jgi:hypothetical protein
MRKLVDAGFPISISSRAAGVVQENKHVKIKRIFTFDGVADGGFGDDAELERVTESLGFNPNEFSKPGDLKLINEELGLFNDDNIKVYDVTDKYPAFLNEESDYSIFDYSIVNKNDKKAENEIIYNKNNSNNMEDKNFVSVEEMYKYSLHVKEEVARIDKLLEGIAEKVTGIVSNTDTTKTDKLAELETAISDMKNESAKLTEGMSTVYKWSEEISNDHNWLASYVESIAKDHNHVSNYVEKLAEDHNAVAAYAEALAEDHNFLAAHHEKLVEDHNYVAGYVDEKLRPMLEHTLGYTERVAEKANIGFNYVEEVIANELHRTQEFVNDVLAEKLNTLWNYTDYIGEKSNEVTHYANYVGKSAATRQDLENVVGFAEAIKESVTNTNTTPVNENVVVNENESIINKYKNLGDKIDNILHSIKTEKVDENNTNYSFLNTLQDEQTKKFINFTEIQKEQIAKSLNPTMKQEEIKQLFESVENPNIPQNENWLIFMPDAVKPLWEKADAGIKEKITRNAKLYTLNSEYQVRNFWTAKVNLLTGQIEPKLNEAIKADNEVAKINEFGYSSDYIKNVMNGLDRFNA